MLIAGSSYAGEMKARFQRLGLSVCRPIPMRCRRRTGLVGPGIFNFEGGPYARPSSCRSRLPPACWSVAICAETDGTATPLSRDFIPEASPVIQVLSSGMA